MVSYRKNDGFPVDLEFKTTEAERIDRRYQTDVWINGVRQATLYFKTIPDLYLVRYAEGFFMALDWVERNRR